MRRITLLSAAVAMLAAGAPAPKANAAQAKDCKDWCAERAAQVCDDVHSSECNVFILGCLAGCGMSFPC